MNSHCKLGKPSTHIKVGMYENSVTDKIRYNNKYKTPHNKGNSFKKKFNIAIIQNTT